MPNSKFVYHSEQELAIFHEGSVLLDAGAGAGKTFVIVEHLIYLCDKMVKAYSEDPKLDFDFYISEKLAKIVIMTFTIKATREIALRIKKRLRFEVEAADESVKNLWTMIENNCTSLKISTIHGVCLAILKEFGYKAFNNNFKISSTIVLQDKVNRLIDQWFEAQETSVDHFTFLNQPLLKKAIQTIFDDPQVRNSFNQSNEKNFDISNITKQLIELLSYNYLFTDNLKLTDYSEYQKSKWYQLILEFQQTTDPFSFALNVARLPPVSKSEEGLVAIVKFFDEFKQFRDHCRNLAEIKQQYSLTQKEYARYKATLISLANYVEKNYLQDDNISFSDLEYFAFKLLKTDELQSKIAEKFSYFIVDEFQDTSSLQFAILKRLINNDFKKLFCVGDLKQAIYGFRGGEIDVFNECASLVEHQYKLLNNYRSDFGIVNFNNHFFETVFTHKNINRELIKFSHQKSIHSEELPNSAVFKLVPSGNGGELELDLDEVEANLIFNYLQATPLNNVAILYKVLSPSHHLIEKFFKANLVVSIQIKIPLNDDWSVGIFKLMLAYYVAETKRDYYLFMLEKYLAVFAITVKKDELPELLEKFIVNCTYFNVYNGYLLFIKSLNITFSTFKQSLVLIENICLVALNRVEKILQIVDSYGEYSSNYELELSGGKIIHLMTTHASKGLEFEQVFVAGIYSNYRGKNSLNPIGETIDALIYKSELVKNENLKTPLKYLAEVVDKLKDKAESDRLLYVACTRAKKNLIWAQLSFLPLDKINVSSWAYHFYNWDQQYPFPAKSIEVEYLNCQQGSVSKLPILQMDNFTVEKLSTEQSYLVLPELSVTKLASITLCPRKFYFKNICKLEESDLMTLDLAPQIIPTENSSELVNSSERGIKLHRLIEHYVKHNEWLELPNESKAITYLKIELTSLVSGKAPLQSELSLKFKLFNYMLSGVIDLLVGKRIIDFKTGLRKREMEEHYWFQLSAYAYGLFELNQLNQSDKIIVELNYIDEEFKVSRELTFDAAKTYLFSYWKKLNSFDQINPAHCAHCEYNRICQV